ncbi:GtrA family protein [Clostridium bornimense]|uniref:GtrA family protein n=1 Tax=Clostridium bornimense TaxID=1216932 RepID=UPI001C0FBE01|nr:GtrA family protein [Clostridium bornimense]MBU5317629.1 GtrA family protein [Clostridium bornimense]
MKKLIEQIFKFGIIGVLAFVIDYGIMILLTEVFNINYLISSGISFTISVIFNYICSMKYVFVGRDDISKEKEFIIFVILSVIGLGINQLVMWLMVDKLGMFYAIVKLFATAVVMVWNFVTRKIFLEKK